jgi:hypothetical protein
LALIQGGRQSFGITSGKYSTVQYSTVPRPRLPAMHNGVAVSLLRVHPSTLHPSTSDPISRLPRPKTSNSRNDVDVSKDSNNKTPSSHWLFRRTLSDAFAHPRSNDRISIILGGNPPRAPDSQKKHSRCPSRPPCAFRVSTGGSPSKAEGLQFLLNHDQVVLSSSSRVFSVLAAREQAAQYLLLHCLIQTPTHSLRYNKCDRYITPQRRSQQTRPGWQTIPHIVSSSYDFTCDSFKPLPHPTIIRGRLWKHAHLFG